ncbi:hypothetical protein EOL96_02800 [Candidatus Saccharibacteria bacterium]|nr:hypothetical protein [Candidatus Saccharibacteria bacterium]
MVATGLAMAIFMAATTTTAPVLAADATRSGDIVSYDNKQFTLLKSTDPLPSGLPSGTSGYQSVDIASKVTYFILTSTNPATATSGQYVFYDGLPTSSFSNPSPPITISIADSGPDSLVEANTDQVTSCDGSITDGLGWILCPTVNFMASAMDHLYGILSSFLEVNPVQTDPTSSLYRMWAIVRDIANICFVIAFVIIVYSQVTSIGISNYNVKRMLPRLVIAAILVNASFLISSLAVDVSNFLGHSIHTLFMNVFQSLNTTAQYKDMDLLNWSNLAGAILSGGSAVAGLGLWANFVVLDVGIKGSLALLIPILVGVLIAVLVALLVMAARQALITVLIIVSPLAFVAFLLPNTEKYFNKWKDLFVTMLVMFPIFATIFGGAQLAGLAIIQNANSLNLIILGMAVMVAPVVITPMLIKFSGSLLGKIAGMVNNPKKGIMDRTRNWAQGKAQEEKAKVLAGRARNSWANRRTRAIDHRRRNREGWKKAHETIADHNFSASTDGHALEVQNRASTTRKKQIDNTFDRSRDGQRLRYQSDIADVDKLHNDNTYSESRYGQNVDRARRVADRDKKLIDNRHDTGWNNAVRTEPELLQKELELKQSTVQAELAKGKLEKMHTGITAQGSNSEHILNLRGVDASTQAQMLNIAHDIKRDSLAATVTATSKASNERQISENLTTALNDNVITIDGQTIVQYAAGVRGEKGERAIIAKAKSEVSTALIEDIKNIQSTMEYDLATDNGMLRQKFEQTHIFAEKVAYAKAMSKNGGPGVAALRKLLMDIGDFSNPSGNLVGKDDMFDFKELLAMESNIMSAGKDIEFFLTNSTQNDPSGNPILGPDGKPSYRTFEQLAKDVKTWTNMSASAFAAQNAATQFHSLQFLYDTNRNAYMQVVNAIRSNPAALGSVKQQVFERFSIYSDSQLEADKNNTLPPPGSIAERDANNDLVIVGHV